MSQKCSQNFPKMSQNVPKMSPKMSQNVPKMFPKLSKKVQKNPKKIKSNPKLFQKQIKNISGMSISEIFFNCLHPVRKYIENPTLRSLSSLLSTYY